MKAVKQSERRIGHVLGAWLLAGAVVLGGSAKSNALNVVAPGAAESSTAVAPGAPVATYSAGIADVLKLADAKVDTGVITTFIRNSSVAYNPSAAEIIALKERGVKPEILTAMLERGAEVRAQAQRAGPATAVAAAPRDNSGAAAQYAPAYASYAYSAPAATYAYPTYYSYAYPAYDYSYYNWGYSWPYYWPALSFSYGCYPYRGYCGYRYPYWGRHGGGNYCGYSGYWGRGGHYGHSGYYGRGGSHGYPHYSGGRSLARPGPHTISRPAPGSGFRSAGAVARPAAFTSTGGGFRSGGSSGSRAISAGGRGGGFGGHAVSFGGRSGGGGGRAGGRGR
ncbi:MAG TPA: hypothetical protein P5205_08865 [Candidatus Paceibacterota bacterium]|nr:hypothetical protein [Verrucomicrobiota bacterium]HSA10467.1 hypothetical protein [Candidatus Paceibacterota bacterium]